MEGRRASAEEDDELNGEKEETGENQEELESSLTQAKTGGYHYKN
jgi:hypothetical protein